MIQGMDWTTALTATAITTALYGAAAWLLKNLIMARLQAAVGHEYDTKIEKIKSDFTAEQERLSTKLRENSAALEAIRSGALQNASARSQSIFLKQIEATDILWKNIISMARAKGVSSTLGVIKLDNLAAYAESEEKGRKFLAAIIGGFNVAEMPSMAPVHEVRHYLSPILYAYYSAYVGIISFSMAYILLVEHGQPYKLLKPESVISLLKEALPDDASYIDQHGTAIFRNLFDLIENKILGEIERFLSGKSATDAELSTAANITQRAQELAAEMAASKVPEIKLPNSVAVVLD